MATTKSKKTVSKSVENIKWPKITVGSHLTVTEFEDGNTILAWDDDALLQEVKAALASAESTTTERKTKRSTKAK